MYSNPTFNPNPLVSQNTKVQNVRLGRLPGPAGQPAGLAAPTSQTYAPGSTFKVVTTSAVSSTSRPWPTMNYPVVRLVTLPNTGTPPQLLTNYHAEACAAGPSSSCSSSPATPPSPSRA